MQKVSVVFLMVMMLVLSSHFSVAQAFDGQSFLQPVTTTVSRFFAAVSTGAKRWYLTWIPGEKPGALVLEQALVSHRQHQSARLTTRVTAEALTHDQSLGTLTTQLSGPFSFSLQNPVAPDTHVELTLTGAATTLMFDGNVRHAHDHWFVRLNQFPTWLVVPPSHQIKDQWLEVDVVPPLNSVVQLPGAVASVSAMPVEWPAAPHVINGLSPAEWGSAMEDLWTRAEVSPARPGQGANKQSYEVKVSWTDRQLLSWLRGVGERQKLEPSQLVEVLTIADEWLTDSDEVVMTVVVDRRTLTIREITLPWALHLDQVIHFPTIPSDAQLWLAALSSLGQPTQLRGQLTFQLAAFSDVTPTTEVPPSSSLAELLGMPAPTASSSAEASPSATINLNDFKLEVEQY